MRAALSNPRFAPSDRIGHALQDGVAGGVAVDVVHALEAVEVADDQAERLVGPAGAFELGVEDLLEATTVEELGERVAVGGVAEAGDQACEPVADDGQEIPGHEQRGDRRDPAVERVLGWRLRHERERIRRGDDREVDERRGAGEEVEGEARDPDVWQRPVRDSSSPSRRRRPWTSPCREPRRRGTPRTGCGRTRSLARRS